MIRHSLQTAQPATGSPGAALPSQHGFSLSGLWRWLAPRRHLPRLHLNELSAHRLRDLGFADGRDAPPRDLWRGR